MAEQQLNNNKEYCHFCGNKLTEKFFEGRDRLFCVQCDRPIYENPIPSTAAVVTNNKGEILLAKRNVEPKVGEWCLPGGFLELNESPEEGCLRELKEETGLEGEIDRPLANVLSMSPIYKSVIVMGYRIKNISGQLKAGDDCDEVVYFKPGVMPPIAFQSHAKILQTALDKGTIRPDLSDPGCFGAYVITSGNHLDIAQRACNAGAKVLQYRDKKADRGEMLEKACAIRKITRKSGTLFIVNDYIDIALMVEADGVHLGQDDIPIEEARKMTPGGFIIGISTHSLEQAIDAEKRGADYIGSGPVFATPTKEDYIPIGIDTLREVLKTVRIPVVAIGGVNPDNIPDLRETGAKNFAMVRAYQADTEKVIKQVNRGQ